MSENRTRFRLNQNRAPIYEALEQFRKMRVVPFDVPGHKRGRGNPELTAFLGQQCVGVDVNSMKPLDNLCHPVSVIREAEVAGRRCLWRCPRYSSWWAAPPAVCSSMVLPPAAR